MKRFLICILSAWLLCSLAACGNEPSTSEKAQHSPPIAAKTDTTMPSHKATTTAPQPGSHAAEPIAEVIPQAEPAAETRPRAEPTAKKKTLIAYFSLNDRVPAGADASAHATPSIGNTEFAAMEIQRQVGGDLFAIKTVKAYPASHRECSAIAEEEIRSDEHPALSNHVGNMDDYDIIYIGYPIWWYQEPMAIRSFLEEYTLSGKTVIPFCTSLGAGISESEDHIKSLLPDATVLPGITLRTGRQDMSSDISKWLSTIGMK